MKQKKPDPDYSGDLIDTLMVSMIVQDAAMESLLELCSTVILKGDQNARAAFMELFQRKKLMKLEEMLIGLEDKSPAYAAKLQAIIDESKKRIKQ